MADIEQERIIDDVSTLRALADPSRLMLLEITMAEPDRAWTARELAARLGILPTNIYYHLNLLERHGLLQVRQTRVVNGIIEKHYGAGQHNLTFHRRSGDAGGALSQPRDAPDDERMLLGRAAAEIPVERVKEFRGELLDLVRRFEAASETGGHPFTLLVSLQPGD